MANLEWASELATDMIDRYGADLTINLWYPGTSANPIEEAEPVKFEFPTKGLFTHFDHSLVNGTYIRKEDRRVVVAAQTLGDFEARIRGSILTAAGRIWQIVDIQELAPDENVILYSIQVRI